MARTKDSHRWDIITDECTICGLKRRRKYFYTKMTLHKVKGTFWEFFIDSEWKMTLTPKCEK